MSLKTLFAFICMWLSVIGVGVGLALLPSGFGLVWANVMQAGGCGAAVANCVSAPEIDAAAGMNALALVLGALALAAEWRRTRSM